MDAKSARASRGVCLALLAAALPAVWSCAAGENPLDAPEAAAAVPLPPVAIDQGTPSGPIELAITTYDGSNQTVEPDVVYVAGGWNGFEYWMAINPYPGGNDQAENASVYASHDGLVWTVPDSLRNPVIPRPSGPIHHNSDPDLVFLPDAGRMVLFDRAVTERKNLLRQTFSDDGVHWSAPATVLETPRHEMVSPTIALVPGRRARLWSVDTGTKGCESRGNVVRVRRWLGEQNGPSALLGARWSEPVATDLQAPEGRILWHLDVIRIAERHEYWAVFPAYEVNGRCNEDDLYIARSRDGKTWQTLPEPLIARGTAPFAALSVYRASTVYDADAGALKVWFSGFGNDRAWHLGYQAFPITSLGTLLDRQRRQTP